MIKLLDHGYIEIIDTWGSDERVIEAARMSTHKGFQGWGPLLCPSCCTASKIPSPGCLTCKGKGVVSGDEKLLKYLWEHGHHTPFEMCGMTIEVQAPIFVFREWMRHRTQSYNELSARYTALPNEHYIPSLERLMASKQASKNKQSSEAGFTKTQAEQFQGTLRNSYEQSRLRYEQLLNQGVAREIARLVVPVAQYSRMRASANIRNWLAFIALRSSPDAQWEIRQYSNVLALKISEAFPRIAAVADIGPSDI